MRIISKRTPAKSGAARAPYPIDAALVEEMNARRELLRKVAVILESDRAKLFGDTIRVLYEHAFPTESR